MTPKCKKNYQIIKHERNPITLKTDASYFQF